MTITEQAFWSPIAAGCAVMMKRLFVVMGNISIAPTIEAGIKSHNPKTGHKKATIITGVAHDPATIVEVTQAYKAYWEKRITKAIITYIDKLSEIPAQGV